MLRKKGKIMCWFVYFLIRYGIDDVNFIPIEKHSGLRSPVICRGYKPVFVVNTISLKFFFSGIFLSVIQFTLLKD